MEKITPKSLMKLAIIILLIGGLLSCSNDNTVSGIVLREWRWIGTYANPHDPYKTAQSSDTTYYMLFLGNGTLQVKDVNKNVKYQESYTVQGNLLTLDGEPFNFNIQHDTLWVVNIWGIVSWYNAYKLDN